MEYFEIVKKLIGEVYPVGDTRIDAERLENLKEMCQLGIDIVEHIKFAIDGYPNAHQHSINQSIYQAETFITEVKSIVE